ncbi:putative calcium-binding protein CML35 [Capsicum chinense]|nr:putative calcium-binding protein CML35 [Capsicum chinense]
MKQLIKNFPKKLFNYSKSTRQSKISRSANTSFGSSSSEFEKHTGASTPTSVLPNNGFSDIYLELTNAFHMMDKDEDGRISREELEEIFSTQVGSKMISKEELTLLLDGVDVDGDGCISLDEFSVVVSAFGVPACDEEMRDTFDFFDVDHDGKITAEELFNVFSMIGDGRCTLEDCKRMIRGVDKNGDGFVCFEDFCVMMEQQTR